MKAFTQSPTAEMLERIRSFDWASTELGAVATWPSALAASVEIVTACASPMLLWWGERSIQIYNDAARRELFARRQGALGMPAAETLGHAWEQVAAAVACVRDGKGAVVCEHVVLDDNRAWSLSLVPVPDSSGGVGGVLVTVRETAATASFVDVCGQHLRSLFMRAPTPIGIVRGPSYIIEVSNVAMRAAFGLDPEDTRGRPVFDVIPEARPLFAPHIDAVMSTGDPKVIKEMKYRDEPTADGQILNRYCNVLFAPVRDLRGKVEAVLLSAVDITEEVRARDEARRLRIDAESANRAKDEFLAMLGHELRNPLAPISTALQLLRWQGAVGRELDVIERQVGHLTRLVDDLLDVSRTLRGKTELHRRDVELAALVAAALELSSPLLEQRGDVVDVDVPRSGLGVFVDRERIVQVITNLLTNAANYSHRGSHISIRGARVENTVRLSVRDHGSGIAPEMLERIFEPFVQQRQTIDRAHGGLGLGLSIVRSLVELHGGTASASSEGLGRGSEFTIALPASARTAASVGESSDAGTTHTTAPRAKILVVDDNTDAAMMMGDALEVLGYQVAVAHDGPSALRIAETFEPDIALLDIGLPVMDGFELAGRLQQQQPPEHRPHLVAVTGYGQDSDRQRSRNAGFERHLVKPVSLGELSRVVTELVA